MGDGLAGLLQSLEPVLVEALVAELAVEALDAAVLHELARLDQQMSHVMLDRLTVPTIASVKFQSGPAARPGDRWPTAIGRRGVSEFLCVRRFTELAVG